MSRRDLPEGAEEFPYGEGTTPTGSEEHRDAQRREARTGQPNVSPQDVANAGEGLGERMNRPIDRSNDVITKPTEAAVPAAGKAAKAEKEAAGFVQRVKEGLKTTKGKVGAGILATGVVLGSVMTYNHFKNKDDLPDSPSR